MRRDLPKRLEAGRIKGSPTWGAYGAFKLLGPCGEPLMVVASGADADDTMSDGWEHVSVSTRRRTPNWTEMSFVKDLFWSDDECVVQFHPPKADYINNHPYCLHLWRHVSKDIPRPPAILVGYKALGTLTP